MELSQKILKISLASILCCSSLCFSHEITLIHDEAINKHHIPYLMQIREYSSAIELYQSYRKMIGRHDFEVLQQMGTILLEQGARSDDPERQLISIFGAGIAGLSSMEILEMGISSHNPQTQLATIQMLGRLQDDRCDEMLIRAMRSQFFHVRLEAGYLLSLRKHRSATGQIEALMYRIPHEFRFFFPEFFATIGTSDAISILRHLMDDKNLQVRISAILSAAQHGRDDLLPNIRNSMSHINVAEQEACVAAIGYLKDSKSLPHLKRLCNSSSETVKLSAFRSLYLLGDVEAAQKIKDMAATRNVMAIAMLGEIAGGEDLLADLIKDENLQVRFNAALSLLKRKDPRSADALYDFLVRDSRDFGFMPQHSVGRSLMSWKVVPSAQQHAPENPLFDLLGATLHMREHILRECLELPEAAFLKIAARLFDIKQGDLIPVLVSLLENLQTPDAIALLQKKSQKAGAPLTRAYCTLSLLRLKQEGPYLQNVRNWIQEKKNAELIRFRPMLPMGQRVKESPYDLTPEEDSRLLIESYEALADRHDEVGIDALLEMIKDGNPKNRYALAGLLILSVQ